MSKRHIVSRRSQRWALKVTKRAVALPPALARNAVLHRVPTDGDALALTFAYPVIKRDWAEEGRIEEKIKAMKPRLL